MIHGRVVQLPHPRGHFPQPNGSHRPLVVFGFNPRQARFGFAQNSGFGFCTLYGGFPTFDFAGTDFDCLQQGFFFDPFFVGGFFPPPDDDEESNDASDGSSAAADADADAYQNVILEEEPVPTVDKVPHHRRSPREPDTLLQLTDGSMYGLRDYWVMDDRLHYVTNYGGQNCIPLSQIDFAKTNQLNADRGLRFSVAQHSSAH